MSVAFDASEGLIVVAAEVTGPTGRAILRLALDTGATSTLINKGPLIAVGYDPASSADQIEVTTGSGIEMVSVVEVLEFSALGQQRSEMPVLAHTLPASAGVDGVLGLDFLRGSVLRVDFRKGKVSIW